MHIRRSLKLSCLLLVLCHLASAANYPRQGPGSSAPEGEDTASRTSTTSTTSASTTTTSSSSSSSSDTTTPTTSAPTTTSAITTPSTPPQTTAPPDTPPPANTAPQATTITRADGVETTVVTNTNTATSSAPSQSKTKSPSEEDDTGGGLGTGSIVGMSVAGGLALIGIIAFFIWKFTRKRSSFDDNEAIKWPDLNSHSATSGIDSHPLPARDTGRGFDTGSDASLAKLNSDNYSTPDFNANDPYAVPPLPHLNPNQPYRDDPTAAGGYYDPYRGPVPGTMEHGSDWHGGEAIPMNQIHGGAPVYDQVGFEQPPYNTGRASPGPHAAYNAGRASPGPHAAYNAGRASPSPQMAYQQTGGYDAQPPYSEAPPSAGRMSPGPQAAYSGRMSPGPNVAYNNTGYSQAAPSYDGYGQR